MQIPLFLRRQKVSTPPGISRDTVFVRFVAITKSWLYNQTASHEGVFVISVSEL
jgi:hypothetical protein